MKIDYGNSEVEEQCTSLRRAKKDFPEKVAKKLLKHINFIESADNLKSILDYRPFRFHKLIGNKNGFYAIDIDGKRSSYRMIIKFDEYDNEQIFGDPNKIEVIQIKEVSKHYE